MLVMHQGTLIEKSTGIKHMLQNNKEEDFARLYRLFSPVAGALEPIAREFKNHIFQEGSLLMDEAERSLEGRDHVKAKEIVSDSKFIDSLIALRNKYDRILQACFHRDRQFQTVLRSAYENFLNRDIKQISMAEILATFSDKILSKGT